MCIFRLVGPWTFFQPTGQNLGRVFNSKSGRMNDINIICPEAKRSRQKQIYLLLTFFLPKLNLKTAYWTLLVDHENDP